MGSPKDTVDPSGRTTPYEEKHGGKYATKLVANAALSQATAIQKPSLLTKNMFLVCSIYVLPSRFNTN